MPGRLCARTFRGTFQPMPALPRRGPATVFQRKYLSQRLAKYLAMFEAVSRNFCVACEACVIRIPLALRVLQGPAKRDGIVSQPVPVEEWRHIFAARRQSLS